MKQLIKDKATLKKLIDALKKDNYFLTDIELPEDEDEKDYATMVMSHYPPNSEELLLLIEKTQSEAFKKFNTFIIRLKN